MRSSRGFRGLAGRADDADCDEHAAVAAPSETLSLELLFREESPRLLRMVARRTKTRDEALDIVQEVFFRMVRAKRRQPGMLDRPAAFLSEIANNLLRDRAKTASRHSAHLHIVADEESLSAPDPQRLLESRDMLNRLEAAISRLKPKTRLIFMAHRVEGLSYSEIAERTGLTIKGVEKQMAKAIAQIDRLLERS